MSDNEAKCTPFIIDPDEDAESGDTNILIIRCVKERPFLFTKSDKRYSDRNITERAWAHIGLELGITKEEAKEKWTRLRNNYSKVLARRKHKNRYLRGYAGGPHHPKPWIYDKEMEFVRNHISQSRNTSTLGIRRSTPSPTPSMVALQYHIQKSEEYDETEVDQSHTPTRDSDGCEFEELEESNDGSSCVMADVDFMSSSTINSNSMSRQITSTSSSTTRQQPQQSQSQSTKFPDSFEEAMLSCTRTLVQQNEEPLLLWFKSVMPTLKTLSPDRLMAFQINTMQEIQRLAFLQKTPHTHK